MSPVREGVHPRRAAAPPEPGAAAARLVGQVREQCTMGGVVREGTSAGVAAAYELRVDEESIRAAIDVGEQAAVAIARMESKRSITVRPATSAAFWRAARREKHRTPTPGLTSSGVSIPM